MVLVQLLAVTPRSHGPRALNALQSHQSRLLEIDVHTLRPCWPVLGCDGQRTLNKPQACHGEAHTINLPQQLTSVGWVETDTGKEVSICKIKYCTSSR